MVEIFKDRTSKHNGQIPRIGVSGTADMSFLSEKAYELAKEIGREVARQGAVTVTGATTGFPFWAAMGAKEEGGISIGFSPAASEFEHTHSYKLPVDYMDFITYTGFGYTGRDLLFTRSADAIIIGAGRIGTIHEFTIAFEDNKPIGILQGEWQTDEIIKTIIENSHRKNDKIIFESDPKILISKIIEMVKKDKGKHYTYKNDDEFGGTSGEVII